MGSASGGGLPSSVARSSLRRGGEQALQYKGVFRAEENDESSRGPTSGTRDAAAGTTDAAELRQRQRLTTSSRCEVMLLFKYCSQHRLLIVHAINHSTEDRKK